MHLKFRDQHLKTIIGRQIDRTHGNHKPKIYKKYTHQKKRDREKGIQRKKRKLVSLSCIRLIGIPQIVACPTTLSMEFSRQEYWRGLSCPSPGDLPYPGSPALQADSLSTEPLRKPKESKHNTKDSHQFTRKENKRRKTQQKRTYRNKPKTVNKMAIRILPINDFFKCKWAKCCNQKTQIG